MAHPQSYLINLITDIVDRRIAEGVHIAIGQVTAYDNEKYLAKVMLAFEQVETPFIRVSGGASGNGFGDKTPLNVDDEVIVAFYGGTVETGVIISRLYSDPTDAPPVTATGDRVLKHSTGSKITFKASGGLELLASAKTSATLNPDGSFLASNGSAQVKINVDNSIELSNAQTKILLSNAGKISLSNSAAELLDLVDQLLTQLTTAANILAPPPTGVGGFNPATITALTLIKTKLATLKA